MKKCGHLGCDLPAGHITLCRPNRAYDNTPDYSAGTDVGNDEGEWAVPPDATPNSAAILKRIEWWRKDLTYRPPEAITHSYVGILLENLRAVVEKNGAT